MEPKWRRIFSRFRSSNSRRQTTTEEEERSKSDTFKQDRFAELDASFCVPVFSDVMLRKLYGFPRSTSWPIIQYPSVKNSWLSDDLVSIPKYNKLDSELQQVVINQGANFVPSFQTFQEIFGLLPSQPQSSSQQLQQKISINMEQFSQRDLRLRKQKQTQLQQQLQQQQQQQSQQSQYSQHRNGYDMILNVNFQQDVEILSIIEDDNMCYEAYWENEYVKIRMLNSEFQMEGQNQLINALRQELEAQQSIHHGNIVRIYGGCLQPPNVCIIEDLQTNYVNLWNYYYYGHGNWSYLEILRITHIMAQALEALHKHMPHGDIRMQNFVVKPPAFIKITNYIKAARVPKKFQLNDIFDVTRAGCIGYMAPEVMHTGVISKSSDIFSFGVVLWEMMSGQKPWLQYNSAVELRTGLSEGKRLEYNPSWPPNFVKILNSCLEDDASQRPTANQLVCLLYTELCTYSDPLDPNNNQPVAQFL